MRHLPVPDSNSWSVKVPNAMRAVAGLGVDKEPDSRATAAFGVRLTEGLLQWMMDCRWDP